MNYKKIIEQLSEVLTDYLHNEETATQLQTAVENAIDFIRDNFYEEEEE